MAGSFRINGVSSAVDADLPVTTDSGIRNLMQKISVLEQEKQELMNAKQSARQKIEELKRQIFRSKSDKKTLDSIAARAGQLETEVSRLQHDLISSATEGQEANAELSELKRVVERLKKSKSEKTNKIAAIQKETNLLLERLSKDTERLKAGENQIRVLEKKIHGFPPRDIGKKTEKKKLKVEDDVRPKMDEKDDQIRSLKRIIDEFQSVVAKNRSETERLKKEKDELEIEKNDLEALLKKSERRVKEMEEKMDGLHKELEAYQNINILLKKKVVERLNGGSVVNDEEKSLMCLKLDWSVVAVTAAVIASVAGVYLRHAKF